MLPSLGGGRGSVTNEPNGIVWRANIAPGIGHFSGERRRRQPFHLRLALRITMLIIRIIAVALVFLISLPGDVSLALAVLCPSPAPLANSSQEDQTLEEDGSDAPCELPDNSSDLPAMAELESCDSDLRLLANANIPLANQLGVFLEAPNLPCEQADCKAVSLVVLNVLVRMLI